MHKELKIARASARAIRGVRRDTRAGKARPGYLDENPGAFTRVTEAYLFLDVRTVTISELKATANINASKIVRGITPLNCKLPNQLDVQLQFKKGNAPTVCPSERYLHYTTYIVRIVCQKKQGKCPIYNRVRIGKHECVMFKKQPIHFG